MYLQTEICIVAVYARYVALPTKGMTLSESNSRHFNRMVNKCSYICQYTNLTGKYNVLKALEDAKSENYIIIIGDLFLRLEASVI